MTLIEIVGLYFSIFAIMNIVLMMRVGKARMAKKVSLGDGNDPELRGHIRAHGNFIETIFFSIAALIILAMLSAPIWALHLVGAATVIGRVSHAMGMSGKHNVGKGRPMGMIIFMLTMVFTIIYVAYSILTTGQI